MAGKTVETLFRFVNDRAATNDVLRDSARIDDALANQQVSLKRLDAAWDKFEDTVMRTARAEREAAEARIKTAKQSADIYGDVSSRTAAIGGLASNLSPVLGSRLMIAADILDATEAAKLLNAELPKMVSQLGLTTGGLMALGVAGLAVGAAVLIANKQFGDMKDSAQELAQVLVGQINALKSYYDFIRDATADDLKARIDELTQRRLLNGQLLADLQVLKTAVDAGLDVSDEGAVQLLGEGAIRALDAVGLMGYGMDELKTAIDETRTANAQYEAELNLLTDAYTRGATVSNDTRQREQENTQRKIAALEREAQTQIQTAQLIETASSEQIRDRLRAIDTERTAYQTLAAELEPLVATSDDAATKLQGARDQLTILAEEGARLTSTVLPLVQAREEEIKRIEKTREALLGFFAGVVDAGKTAADTVLSMAQRIQQGAQLIAQFEGKRSALIDETGARLADTEQKYQAQRLADEAAFEATRTEAAQKQQDVLADLLTQHQDREQSLRDEYERGEAQRIKTYYRDRARAEADHRDTLLDAASRLDATAVWEEQRKFTREQRQASEDFKDETKQRADQFKDRLKQEDKAYRDRRQQAEQAYRREEERQRAHFQRAQREQDMAHQNELTSIRQDGAAKLTALTTAHQNQLRELMGYQTNEYTVRSTHYASLLTQLETWKRDAEAVLARPPTTTTTASGSPTITRRVIAGGATLTPFHAGGYAPDGPIRTRAGEFVSAPLTTRLMEQGIGAPLTQANIQRFMTSNQTRNVGPFTVNVYEANNAERTGEIVRREIMAIVG